MEEKILKIIDEVKLQGVYCGQYRPLVIVDAGKLAKRIADSIVIDESILTVILMSFKDCDNWEELAKAIAKAKPFTVRVDE